MEHVTITELTNGFKKLVPDEGYILKYGDKTYSEAVVKDIKGWTVEKVLKLS